MMYAGVPSFLFCCWRTVVFQLYGFYCNMNAGYCRMMYAGVPFLLLWGCRTGVFQLSGFYCNMELEKGPW